MPPLRHCPLRRADNGDHPAIRATPRRISVFVIANIPLILRTIAI
jgi:hypothetical protein